MGVLIRLPGDKQKSPQPDLLEPMSTSTNTVLQQTLMFPKITEHKRLGISLPGTKQKLAHRDLYQKYSGCFLSLWYGPGLLADICCL